MKVHAPMAPGRLPATDACCSMYLFARCRRRVQVSDLGEDRAALEDSCWRAGSAQRGSRDTLEGNEMTVGSDAHGTALQELSMASISSARSVRSGSVDEDGVVDARQEEAVLHEWGPGKLYEWMVSIDLEMYADALQIRSIAGDACVAALLCEAACVARHSCSARLCCTVL